MSANNVLEILAAYALQTRPYVKEVELRSNLSCLLSRSDLITWVFDI